MNNKFCVVFICDKAYFNKFIDTCSQLLTKGRYNGNICLVIGDDLHNNELLKHPLITGNNIIVKYFPTIQFSADFHVTNNKIKSDGRNLTKKFQWHKMHLFNTFFKQWNYIFYLDCGLTIFSDISPITDQITENTILAHSDAYPSYQWKLHTQFDTENMEYFTKLNAKYDLNIDYPQTTIMLYDTKIIEPDTYTNLIQLTEEYPISRTNEQGIMALYFTNITPAFKQLKTHNDQQYFYDYMSRNRSHQYIILKSA